jgi:hypothetical protein
MFIDDGGAYGLFVCLLMMVVQIPKKHIQNIISSS